MPVTYLKTRKGKFTYNLTKLMEYCKDCSGHKFMACFQDSCSITLLCVNVCEHMCLTITSRCMFKGSGAEGRVKSAGVYRNICADRESWGSFCRHHLYVGRGRRTVLFCWLP